MYTHKLTVLNIRYFWALTNFKKLLLFYTYGLNIISKLKIFILYKKCIHKIDFRKIILFME